MSTRFLFFLFAGLPVCAWALLSGSGTLFAAREKERERVFDVTGIVRARLDDGQLVIAHDEIPGYMGAMTMAFTPAGPEEAAGVAVNDRVRFRLRVNGGRSRAEAFVVTGRAAAPGKPATSSQGGARRGRLREGDAVPAFSLFDERGQPLTAEALRGRLTIVTFIFTRCPVPEYCPAISRKFDQLQPAVRKGLPAESAAKVRLLSITLDPEFDRPDILKAYGEAMGADPAIWNFATGEKAEIDALVKAFAVYRENNGVTLDHTLATALIGPDGRVADIWRGNGWTVDEVIASLRKAANVTGR
ncbi:SCO family protein [Termitidicoccus mucosus]|uniref:Thioredoxin domain-containing protein n=1 Tax=Termitidicoccus mucosus TaxID=1184151 RepID=A0A178IJJ9_9BACT|nr:hypothetical protein AW736_09725 [Opitutaceae bacterium TSB47]